MGLAEPRKRLKISHDPNNLAWTQSAESYGQKLLSSQGWKPGQGLGARNAKNFNSSPVPKLLLSYKDDTLGLGASLKSQDPMHARTGLDAFQGLLGRLNGKNDSELEKEVQKNDDRKLAMWAHGRWGGVVFVPGGTLVQGDGYKKAEGEGDEEAELRDDSQVVDEFAESKHKVQQKAEKMRRKDEKQRKREAESAVERVSPEREISKLATDDVEARYETQGLNSIVTETYSGRKRKKKKERKAVSSNEHSCTGIDGKLTEGLSVGVSSLEVPELKTNIRTSNAIPRTSRHVIRGRNIEAKRMAFSDTKMLDQIFMVKG